jgi:hypothetical protein
MGEERARRDTSEGTEPQQPGGAAEINAVSGIVPAALSEDSQDRQGGGPQGVGWCNARTHAPFDFHPIAWRQLWHGCAPVHPELGFKFLRNVNLRSHALVGRSQEVR